LTADELDDRVEAWFRRRDATVDFEVDDGLRKLRELSLVTEDDERLYAVDLGEAKRRIDGVWDALFDGDGRVGADLGRRP
jgi:hypothetical protein